MAIKKKLKGKSGFTLAETLLAVLIMLLVSAIMANGIPVVKNVYNNVIVGSNAQVLLSTAVIALRNELGTAQNIDVSGTTITYFNATSQSYSKISLSASDPKSIKVDPYISFADKSTPVTGSKQRDLVSNAASNKDLYVTYESVAYDRDKEPDMIVFKKIEIKRINDNAAVLASLDELKIRLVPIAGSEA